MGTTADEVADVDLRRGDPKRAAPLAPRLRVLSILCCCAQSTNVEASAALCPIGILQRGETTAARLPADAREQQEAGDDLEILADDETRRRDRPSGHVDLEDKGWLWAQLGDWGGLRTQLEDRGVDVELLYSYDGSTAVSGEVSSDDPVGRGLLDLTVTLDTFATTGIEGGTAHAAFQRIHGTDASVPLGVLQPVSNIDSDNRTQLSRIWYEQEFESTGTRVRFGKIDANSQFAFVDSGAQFLHSSMGFSPTIFLMPSYPDAAFGATIVQDLGAAGVRFGAFDGAFARGVATGEKGLGSLFDGTEEYFFIGELDATWETGRVALGGWFSSADIGRFDGGTQDGTGGYHATAEQRVWGGAREDAGRLDAFLQLGRADGEVSPFEDHIGAGVAWSAPMAPLAPQAGIGVSRAGLSGEAGAGFSTAAETAFELYYGFEPIPWVRIKPDIQLVVDPGGDAARDEIWIASVRVTLAI